LTAERSVDFQSLLSFPRTEFHADLAAWGAVGIAVSIIIWSAYGVPGSTVAKIIIGCLTAAILVGMIDFLEMEKEVIEHSKAHGNAPHVEPHLRMSVTRKITFLVATVLGISALVFSFMLTNDVAFVLSKKEALLLEDFYAVFYEGGFVVGVMMLFSLAIIGLFSRNLKMHFNLHMETLESVENGMYDRKVPIASTDEFGIMGHRINKMIAGLAERNFIRETFGRYVPKEISDLIISRSIPLEGELREVTILFCDLRGYTGYVESSHPREVVQKLNRYFTRMTDAIQQFRGLVLQYIGDEIEAAFGAPAYINDHPEMAVRAALEMRRQLEQLNEEWVTQGMTPFKHGIGIHTGEVLAGNIGSPQRLSYALVGDAVNLASRIQGMTKEFACDILVSEETRKRLPEDFDAAYMGKVKVKGKREEIPLFKIRAQY
jgi:adenylate cyclase